MPPRSDSPRDKQNYPEALRALMPEATEAELAEGRPHETLRPALANFDFSAAVAPRKVVEPALAEACLAGLWLGHNFLDESHAISQQIENPTGSFWHGIMHRRQRDYDNACYWFRRVGRHAVHEPLRAAAAALVRESQTADDPYTLWLVRQRQWDAAVFVDCVRSVMTQRRPEVTTLCRQIARREWELLFDFCYAGAIGL